MLAISHMPYAHTLAPTDPWHRAPSLAQTGVDYAAIMMWFAVIIVAALVLGAAVMAIRRWARGRAEPQSPWTMDQLEQLRASGELSQQEFESLRSATMRSHLDRRQK